MGIGNIEIEASVSCLPLQESFWKIVDGKENQHFIFVFFSCTKKEVIYKFRIFLYLR
jgi:hypothetical protein